MIFEFNLKLFFVKLIFLFLFIFQFDVIASSKLDCKEKAFYVNNVISDAKHQDLTKAKSKAEEKGRLIAFNQLLNRLTIRKQIKDSYKIDYQATLNSLNAAKAAGASNFVLLSAYCVRKPLLQFQNAKLKVNESELFHSSARKPNQPFMKHFF